jgi:histone deacetylase 6
MELHVPPGPHVERPARTATLAALLVRLGVAARCRAVTPRPAADSELIRAHSPGHIEKVDGYFEAVAGKMRDSANAAALTRAQAAARGEGANFAPSSSASSSSPPDDGSGNIRLVPFESGDMFWSPGTASAARLAAGCVTQAALAVLSGEARRAFAVVRPPGHHAECSRAQGFCFFNNVALAALAAIEAGAKRVLVVDWDVHHGEECTFFSLLLWRRTCPERRSPRARPRAGPRPSTRRAHFSSPGGEEKRRGG